LASGETTNRRWSEIPDQTCAARVEEDLGAVALEGFRGELIGARSVGRRWCEVEDEVVRRGERMKVTVRMGYL
jgi:hypothetical protein